MIMTMQTILDVSILHILETFLASIGWICGIVENKVSGLI